MIRVLAKFSNITHYKQYLSDPAAANHLSTDNKTQTRDAGAEVTTPLILDNTNNIKWQSWHTGHHHQAKRHQGTFARIAIHHLSAQHHLSYPHVTLLLHNITSDVLRLFLFNWLPFIVFLPLCTIITMRLFLSIQYRSTCFWQSDQGIIPNESPRISH